MKIWPVYPIVLALLLCTGSLPAQSFLKKYPYPTGDAPAVQSVFAYPNGDIGLPFLTSVLSFMRTDANGNQLSFTQQAAPVQYVHFLESDGVYVLAFQQADSLVVWKRNPDGSTVWRQAVLLQTDAQVNTWPGLTENETGEIFVRGAYWITSIPNQKYFTAKFSAGGTFQWINTLPTNGNQSSLGVVPDAMGGCLSGWLVGDANGVISNRLYRYNADGTTAWSIEASGWIGGSPLTKSYASNAAGQSLVISSNDLNGPAEFHNWMLLGSTGDTLWNFNTQGNTALDHLVPQLVLPTADLGFVVCGRYENDPINTYTATAVKVDVAGNIEWVLPFGQLVTPWTSQLAYFSAGRVLADGSILAAGLAGDVNFLIKIPPDGAFGYQNVVRGHVAHDSDLDCIPGPADPPVAGWTVTAQTTGLQSFGSTDANGNYQIPYLDTGLYQIILTPPNYLWQACEDTVEVYFPPSGAVPLSDTVDFLVQTLADCSLLEVDLTTWNLRSCMTRPMSATVCNNGTTDANPMQLTLVLDPLLSLVGADYPYSVNGDTIVFAPDSLPSLHCKTYHLNVLTSCAAMTGQTLCTKAHVSPDTLCINPPGWSGASIEVSAACEGDSVRFSIRNTGGAPTIQPLDFVIIDDHVITRTGQFELQPGETQQEMALATGATWRLTADQEPGHPFVQYMPSVALEGCVTSGPFSTGMINLFANHSGDPFDDIECREVTGSYDPNDKTGWPLGLPSSNCIEARQELDYLVRFQNTGNDTAFYVEIQDTLATWLDPASIHTVTASHPFRWVLSGPGILRFIFDGIALPDSNANEAASHGFVRFQIAQRPGNPIGAILENRAGIYFDNNPVVLTNTTFHMVCQDFVDQTSRVIYREQAELPVNNLRIFPNPAAQELTVQIQPEQFGDAQIRLMDVFGRVIWQQSGISATTIIPRNGLPNGFYFIELEAENGLRMVRSVVFE